MKLFKLNFAILLLLILTSCVSTLPLNQQFFNNKKVGVIIQVDSIGMAKAGSQGLLDMALTPGNRFTEPLKIIEPKFNLSETLKSEITNILKSKNKQFEIITDKFNYESLTKFEKPSSDKKYSKKDFRNLKIKNNVDEILFVKVKYGILVSYYGLIELDKQGYVNIRTEVVELNDNSLLQQETFQTVANMDGNWKKGEDFENLKNSIQDAISSSIIKLKTKLFLVSPEVGQEKFDPITKDANKNDLLTQITLKDGRILKGNIIKDVDSIIYFTLVKNGTSIETQINKTDIKEIISPK